MSTFATVGFVAKLLFLFLFIPRLENLGISEEEIPVMNDFSSIVSHCTLFYCIMNGFFIKYLEPARLVGKQPQ